MGDAVSPVNIHRGESHLICEGGETRPLRDLLTDPDRDITGFCGAWAAVPRVVFSRLMQAPYEAPQTKIFPKNSWATFLGVDLLLIELIRKYSVTLCTHCSSPIDQHSPASHIGSICRSSQRGVIAIAMPITEAERGDLSMIRLRAEMFGSERVILNGYIRRFEELTQECVRREDCSLSVLIESRTLPLEDSVQRQVEARLGSLLEHEANEVSIFLFADRVSRGECKARLSRRVQCGACGHVVVLSPPLKTVAPAVNELCHACEGSGFINTIGICALCGGVGNSPAESYSLWGLHIHSFAAMDSISLLRQMRAVKNQEETVAFKTLRVTLEALIRYGLERVPLGLPYSMTSSIERARLQALRLVLGGLTDSLIIFDDMFSQIHSDEYPVWKCILADFTQVGCTVLVIDVEPPSESLLNHTLVMDRTFTSATRVDLHTGTSESRGLPVQYPSFLKEAPKQIEILQNQITVVCGASGSGKSVLLQVIEQSAIKALEEARKAKEQGSTFEDVRAPFDRIMSFSSQTISTSACVAEILGLDHLIAQHYAMSAYARLRGLTEKDLVAAQKNMKSEETIRSEGDQTEISIHAGVTFSDLYKKSLQEISVMYQGNNQIVQIVEICRAFGVASLALGVSATLLDRSVRESLFLSRFFADSLSPVLNARSARRRRNHSTLLLLDDPFSGIGQGGFERIIAYVQEIKERGVTLVCIDNRARFKLLADRVIHTRPELSSLIKTHATGE